eukprot:maker-scaffold_55-snap-gene-0.46-mRNA-1 protein AED:0.07 eAED:0.07 QI:273/0.5/0.33/1/1/1/3/0/280
MIRTAICTGASSGIGEASAKKLTKNGFRVIGIGRNVDSLQKLKQEGSIFDFVACDLTKPNACAKAVKESMEKLGSNALTTLVNSAGIFRGGEVGQTSVQTYEEVFKANVQTVFEMTEEVIPLLKSCDKTLHPSVINISSVTGLQSFGGCAVYCASKSAVDQLTRCGSVDLAKFGIRVNAVNPGVVSTPIHNRGGVVGEAYDNFLTHSLDTHPLAKSVGRVISPNEVADLVYFLTSSESRFITGECIAIDGGRQNLGARTCPLRKISFGLKQLSRNGRTYD